jgi:hypothetical protein
MMGTKKITPTFPPESLALYDHLVAGIPGLERKGATMPYTSINGNMFSFLAKDGSLALRLPGEARAAFLERYHTSLVEANGTVLKEYVVVPADLLENTPEMKPYFELSFEYARTLKPKPNKKMG